MEKNGGIRKEWKGIGINGMEWEEVEMIGKKWKGMEFNEKK